jgi:hypothetical protein
MLNGNVFYNGAEPSEKDDDFENSPDYNPEIKLTEKGDNLFLNFNFDKAFYNHKTEIVTTEKLGKAVIPKAAFDNRDGTKLEIDHDFFGKKRSENNCAGPFSQLKKGEVNLKVW